MIARRIASLAAAALIAVVPATAAHAQRPRCPDGQTGYVIWISTPHGNVMIPICFGPS